MPKGKRGGTNNGGNISPLFKKKGAETYMDVYNKYLKEANIELQEKQKAYFEKRFEGLNARSETNNYITMDRVSADGDTVVVKVGENHLIKTRYGGALVLDQENVVFLKDSQFSQNYYGTEVKLSRSTFTPKKWGDHSANFGEEPQNLNFDTWKKVAKSQQKAGNAVKWEKTAGEKTTQSMQHSQMRKKVEKLAKAEWEKKQGGK